MRVILMPKSVNRVALLGHVGKEPEVNNTPSGTLVVKFTLATSDRYKDNHGDFQERTDWHSLVAFSKTGEIIRDYVKKGSSKESFRPGAGTTRNPVRSAIRPKLSSGRFRYLATPTAAAVATPTSTSATVAMRPMRPTAPTPTMLETMGFLFRMNSRTFPLSLRCCIAAVPPTAV